jgi:pSer/pThr/pTyr-binding forkhead associated (FHA) protein
VTDWLFVEERPVVGRVVPVRAGHVIGRDSEVVAADPEVSRRHARLVAAGDALAIVDAGSLNGTFVNGDRIDDEVTLRRGDVVRVGSTVWRVASRDEIGGEPARSLEPTRASRSRSSD